MCPCLTSGNDNKVPGDRPRDENEVNKRNGNRKRERNEQESRDADDKTSAGRQRRTSSPWRRRSAWRLRARCWTMASQRFRSTFRWLNVFQFDDRIVHQTPDPQRQPPIVNIQRLVGEIQHDERHQIDSGMATEMINVLVRVSQEQKDDGRREQRSAAPAHSMTFLIDCRIYRPTGRAEIPNCTGRNADHFGMTNASTTSTTYWRRSLACSGDRLTVLPSVRTTLVFECLMSRSGRRHPAPARDCRARRSSRRRR